MLWAKANKYLAFLEYPDEVRKHIYTTGVVESVNAGIELMRLELGGYFPPQRSLKVNLFIQVVNLQDRWWRRPVLAVRVKTYELLQIFSMRYELADDFEPIHIFRVSLPSGAQRPARPREPPYGIPPGIPT